MLLAGRVITGSGQLFSGQAAGVATEPKNILRRVRPMFSLMEEITREWRNQTKFPYKIDYFYVKIPIARNILLENRSDNQQVNQAKCWNPRKTQDHHGVFVSIYHK